MIVLGLIVVKLLKTFFKVRDTFLNYALLFNHTKADICLAQASFLATKIRLLISLL